MSVDLQRDTQRVPAGIVHYVCIRNLGKLSEGLGYLFCYILKDYS